MCTFLNNKDEDSHKRRHLAYRILESLGKIRDFQGLRAFLEIKNRVFGKKISLNLLSQLIWIIILLAGIYPHHIGAEAENALNSENAANILIQNQNNVSFI